MEIYRICLSKWSKKLTASGFPGRWNSKGKYVLYTAWSRSLACLENVVHRSGEGLNGNFKVMVIMFPETLKIREIELSELPVNWAKYSSYTECQKIGDEWLENDEYPILKVPSSIIQQESNYLINVNHLEMKKVKITSIEDFEFDSRIKE